jgi:hypothetical protein
LALLLQSSNGNQQIVQQYLEEVANLG